MATPTRTNSGGNDVPNQSQFLHFDHRTETQDAMVGSPPRRPTADDIIHDPAMAQTDGRTDLVHVGGRFERSPSPVTDNEDSQHAHTNSDTGAQAAPYHRNESGLNINGNQRGTDRTPHGVIRRLESEPSRGDTTGQPIRYHRSSHGSRHIDRRIPNIPAESIQQPHAQHGRRDRSGREEEPTTVSEENSSSQVDNRQ